jgi:hypothetical protein
MTEVDRLTGEAGGDVGTAVAYAADKYGVCESALEMAHFSWHLERELLAGLEQIAA